MRYIPPKKVRAIYLIALAAAALVLLLGTILQSAALMYASTVPMFLDMFFFWIWYRCPHCGRHLGRCWGAYCPHCGKKVDV